MKGFFVSYRSCSGPVCKSLHPASRFGIGGISMTFGFWDLSLGSPEKEGGKGFTLRAL